MAITLQAEPGSETVPASGGELTCRLTIETDFDRGEQLPKHLALCIDSSKSMSGNKMRDAKEGAKEAVDVLDDRDYISVVDFNTSATRVLDPTQCGGNRQNIKDCIDDITSGGGTNIIDGLKEAKSALDEASSSGGLFSSILGNNDDEFIRWVVFVSDGKPSTVPDMIAKLMPKKSSVDRHISVVEGFADDGVTVQAVGVGPSYNEDIIRGVAEATRGKSEHLSNSAAFADYFRGLVDEAEGVVEVDPTLSLTPRGKVAVGEVYQHEPRLNEFDPDRSRGTLTVDLPYLEANVTQEVLVELDVPSGEAGTERLVLETELNAGGESVTAEAVVEYRSSDDAGLTLDDRKRIDTKARRLAVENSPDQAAAYLDDQDDDVVFEETRKYVDRLARASRSGDDNEEKTIKNELTKPGLTTADAAEEDFTTSDTDDRDDGEAKRDSPVDASQESGSSDVVESKDTPEDTTEESDSPEVSRKRDDGIDKDETDDSLGVVREEPSKKDDIESAAEDDADGVETAVESNSSSDDLTAIAGILSAESVAVGTPVSIEVRDETGARLDGAVVEYSGGQATTDDRGTCELVFDTAGTYELTCRKDGAFGTDSLTVSVTDDDTVTGESTAEEKSDDEAVAPESGATDGTTDVIAIPESKTVGVGEPLDVTVRDETGTRMADVTVTTGGTSSTTDDRGRCRLVFDGPGEYELTPEPTDPDGYHSISSTVSVEDR